MNNVRREVVSVWPREREIRKPLLEIKVQTTNMLMLHTEKGRG